MTARLGMLVRTQEGMVLLAMLLFGALVEIRNPDFLRYDNLILVLKSAAPLFIVALATTFVLVGGGIDLSLGAVAAFTGVITGELLIHGVAPPLAIIGGFVSCLVVGAIYGALVVWVQVPALIVTLGAMYVVRGVALEITDANPLYPFPASFNRIAQGTVLGVPLLVVYAAVFGVIAYIALHRTRYGYRVRAVGGNAAAARSAGIRTKRIQLSLYVVSTGGAGIAGILLASRLGTGDPNGSQDMALTVISAVIIGGTSLFGGLGSIVGTIIGSLLLSVMSNGLLLMNVSPFYQQIAVGAIMVAAVAFDAVQRRGRWNSAIRNTTRGLGRRRVLTNPAADRAA